MIRLLDELDHKPKQQFSFIVRRIKDGAKFHKSTFLGALLSSRSPALIFNEIPSDHVEFLVRITLRLNMV